mmetsp:Transcript_137413/g.342756  ORF Transcript_137413/g.342756 Transcript_137413/m.342756 type:complete len:220 (+) Transcript_137413:332-991(+)
MSGSTLASKSRVSCATLPVAAKECNMSAAMSSTISGSTSATFEDVPSCLTAFPCLGFSFNLVLNLSTLCATFSRCSSSPSPRQNSALLQFVRPAASGTSVEPSVGASSSLGDAAAAGGDGGSGAVPTAGKGSAANEAEVAMQGAAAGAGKITTSSPLRRLNFAVQAPTCSGLTPAGQGSMRGGSESPGKERRSSHSPTSSSGAAAPSGRGTANSQLPSA